MGLCTCIPRSCTYPTMMFMQLCSFGNNRGAGWYSMSIHLSANTYWLKGVAPLNTRIRFSKISPDLYRSFTYLHQDFLSISSPIFPSIPTSSQKSPHSRTCSQNPVDVDAISQTAIRIVDLKLPHLLRYSQAILNFHGSENRLLWHFMVYQFIIYQYLSPTSWLEWVCLKIVYP